MFCPGRVSAGRRFLRRSLRAARLVLLPVRGDKRAGRRRCGVLKGKKLMTE